jgi:hypothetical protein
MSTSRNSTNEISEVTVRTDKVRPPKEQNNLRKAISRTRSRWNSELPNNWLQRVKRMKLTRIPRMAVEYRREVKRDIGRPKTRWTDQSIFRIEFSQDRTRKPASVHLGDDDDDDYDDDLWTHISGTADVHDDVYVTSYSLYS